MSNPKSCKEQIFPQREEEETLVQSDGYWTRVWQRLRRHRLAMVSMSIVALLVTLCVVGPWISPYDYDFFVLRDRLQPPSSGHWFGTDDIGRDILTRIMMGGRISLLVGFLSALLATTIGALIGLISAYAGGVWDGILMRATDFIISLPIFPLLLVISRFFGGSVINIIVVLAALRWTRMARLVRGTALSLKNQEFVLAAQSIGASDARIISRHLLPNVMAPIIVSMTLDTGAAIVMESALSYLGLGVMPPTPTWGNMLTGAQDVMQEAPWMAITPGVFIFLTLVCVNFVGDGLRDALDPLSLL